MFCLDQCTHADDPAETQRQSVERTLDWARRCRTEFDRMHARQGGGDAERPRLFAVVQGGDDAELRRHCAEALVEIGFDGYGFGGWPVADDGRLTDMVGHVAELLPADVPLHALGVGKPENIVTAHDLGYSTFDSALPTRDGRRRRLFVPTVELTPQSVRGTGFYRYLHIGDDRYRRDADPVDPSCDCPCCRQVSRGYLHHLFNVEDSLALRLATLHNLRFVNRLAEVLGAPG
jgi:queuine tRNA-ribosyltransferase